MIYYFYALSTNDWKPIRTLMRMNVTAYRICVFIRNQLWIKGINFHSNPIFWIQFDRDKLARLSPAIIIIIGGEFDIFRLFFCSLSFCLRSNQINSDWNIVRIHLKSNKILCICLPFRVFDGKRNSETKKNWGLKISKKWKFVKGKKVTYLPFADFTRSIQIVQIIFDKPFYNR